MWNLFKNEIIIVKRRSMTIDDLESWTKVEKVYRNMRVYNIIYMNWLRVLLGPILFTACSGLLWMLYVTVRPSGLPMWIYVWIPILAVMTAFITAWLWYDGVLIKRLGDEVLESL